MSVQLQHLKQRQSWIIASGDDALDSGADDGLVL